MVKLSAVVERFPIAGTFTISRGSKTEAVSVVVNLTDGDLIGRGECIPYARYGETIDSVMAAIESARAFVEAGGDRQALRREMAAGAARNAIDCAMIDLEAKRARTSAANLLGLPPLRPVVTAYTLSLASPEAMHAAAAAAASRPLLKIKLGGTGDRERLFAVRSGAPASRIIVDANEGWTEATFADMMAACVDAGVALIEQPLPAGQDGYLARVAHAVPICADESAHVGADIPHLATLYDAVNVKLDKTGGLTEALDMIAAAEKAGLQVMVGCMVAGSLAMAPAFLAAQRAAYADIDGPLLLARDRDHAMIYEGSLAHPPSPALWG